MDSAPRCSDVWVQGGGRAQATQKVEKVAGRGSVKMCRGNQLAMISLELYRLPEQPCVQAGALDLGKQEACGPWTSRAAQCVWTATSDPRLRWQHETILPR